MPHLIVRMISFARVSRVGNVSTYSDYMRGGMRCFSLTHVDEQQGTPRMVDVSDKAVTKRTASAKGSVLLPKEIARHLEGVSKEIMSKKGPVFATATVAGVMAAKNTSNLIPFCHPLPLDSCKIDINLVESNNPTHPLRVDIVAAVKTTHRTGVEMEALTAVNVAALTVYDMLKALSQSMIITDISLTTKTGGKSDL